jgi:hypothetical protein
MFPILTETEFNIHCILKHCIEIMLRFDVVLIMQPNKQATVLRSSLMSICIGITGNSLGVTLTCVFKYNEI